MLIRGDNFVIIGIFTGEPAGAFDGVFALDLTGPLFRSAFFSNFHHRRRAHPMPQHILQAFEEALRSLKQDVIKMASLAQQNVTGAVHGLLERDDDQCNRVIADDNEVDQLEKSIDQSGLEIIMKYSPVATDLRRVFVAMKIGQQLERISDEAVTVARRARKINSHAPVPESQFIQSVYDLAVAMLRDAVVAFNVSDLKLALALEERDDELDRIYSEAIRRMIRRSEEDVQHIDDYVDLMFIVRALERVGDHAVNIAEDIVYAETAHDIRHGGERPVIS
jgi:phosphate transport system protein